MKRVIENVPHWRGSVCFIISLRDLFAYHGHDLSERTSTSKTKQELKTLLIEATETISQISDIGERA